MSSTKRIRRTGAIAAGALVATTLVAGGASAAPASTVHTTDMSTWTTTGAEHMEPVDGGLHISTDGAKVSALKPGGFGLLDNPHASMDFVGSGTAPGLQAVVFINGNWAGTLVGESDHYGENWWATNATLGAFAPQTGSGQGSQWFGTLPDWASSLKGNGGRVEAVGFSLGSGVAGDGVIRSMTFGGTTFTFGLPTDDANTGDGNTGDGNTDTDRAPAQPSAPHEADPTAANSPGHDKDAGNQVPRAQTGWAEGSSSTGLVVGLAAVAAAAVTGTGMAVAHRRSRV